MKIALFITALFLAGCDPRDFFNPQLPEGYYLEHDTVNDRWRWCKGETQFCTMFDKGTRWEAIRSAISQNEFDREKDMSIWVRKK